MADPSNAGKNTGKQSGNSTSGDSNSGHPVPEKSLPEVQNDPPRFKGRGDIQSADFNFDVEAEREFHDALSQETEIPELEAASKDDASGGKPHISSNGGESLGRIRFIAMGMLGLLLVVVLFLGRDRLFPGKPVPTLPPSPPLPGPAAGTPMSWLDGSTLMFIPDPNGQDSNGARGFWITLNPISNYQFSLCVRAGMCKPPTDPDALNSYDDPSQVDQPVGIMGPDIVGPDRSAGYCGWMKGRLPTEAEFTLANRSLPAFGPEYGFSGGVHCVIDHPLPMPQFVGSSPFYDPTVPREDMTVEVIKSTQFCQNQQPFQTMDLLLDSDASLQSVAGKDGADCQLVSANRVVCFGGSNPNPQAEVGLLCDGFRGARCQLGSTLSAAGCSNNLQPGPIAGLEGWELGANGVLAPIQGVPFPDGGISGTAWKNNFMLHGVMVAESLSGNGLASNGSSFNGLPGNALPDNSVPDNGSSGNNGGSASNDLSPTATPVACNRPVNGCPTGFNFDPINCVCAYGPIACPPGMYYDSNTQTCNSLGPATPACLSGFHFSPSLYGCETNFSQGDYPGCPLAQMFDPVTGKCDVNTTVLSPTSHLMTAALPVSLPDCAQPAKNKGGSGNGPCPAGQSYVCSGIKTITCSCK